LLAGTNQGSAVGTAGTVNSGSITIDRAPLEQLRRQLDAALEVLGAGCRVLGAVQSARCRVPCRVPPSTQHPAPGTAPGTQHAAPGTAPSTQHPAPGTQHAAPGTREC